MITDCPGFNEHALKITISPVPRKGKSFWSSFAKESVQRWTIKAKDEEDLVDWIVAIKAKIESYIPENPPAPLYQSSASLESKVNISAEKNNEVKNEAFDIAQHTDDSVPPQAQNEKDISLTKDAVVKQTSADTLTRQDTFQLVS